MYCGEVCGVSVIDVWSVFIDTGYGIYSRKFFALEFSWELISVSHKPAASLQPVKAVMGGSYGLINHDIFLFLNGTAILLVFWFMRKK